MLALNLRDRTTPVIAEHYLHRAAGNQPVNHAIISCVLLALPNTSLSFMTGIPDTGKLTTNRPRHSAPGLDHLGIWLRNAAAGLCLLAAAAAAVSFTAQYRLIYATRLAIIAGLEAAIPDAAALVFACLGIALALHGKRAIRPRILNLASVAASVFMNTIAAAPGWRSLAIWSMPPSPTAWPATPSSGWSGPRSPAIRTRALPWSPKTRRRWPQPAGWSCGCCAWPWRPPPPWPGSAPGSWPNARSPPAAASPPAGVPRPTKTVRFLLLVTERHGPLAALPLHAVAGIAADLAPQADLNAGSARAALRKAVLAARNGDPR